MLQIQIVGTVYPTLVFRRYLHIVTIQSTKICVVVLRTVKLMTLKLITVTAMTYHRFADDALLTVVKHAYLVVLVKVTCGLNLVHPTLKSGVLKCELNETGPPRGDAMTTLIRVTVTHIQQSVQYLVSRKMKTAKHTAVRYGIQHPYINIYTAYLIITPTLYQRRTAVNHLAQLSWAILTCRRTHELIRRRKQIRDYPGKALIVRTEKGDVYIVIPWDTSLMTDCPQQSAVRKKIRDIISTAYLVYLN